MEKALLRIIMDISQLLTEVYLGYLAIIIVDVKIFKLKVEARTKEHCIVVLLCNQDHCKILDLQHNKVKYFGKWYNHTLFSRKRATFFSK